MRWLTDAVRRLAYLMHAASGVVLIAMIATVLADIVTRTAFGLSGGGINFTFRGAVEIVSYGLLIMVLFALPYSVNRGQVIVDLFTERMSERWKEALAGLFSIGFGLLGLGMAIRFSEAIGRVAATGETTQDLLIPLGYIYGIAAFGAAMLSLRGFLVGYRLVIEAWGRQQ